MDVLPTLHSLAKLESKLEVDGMDLSHYFLNESGVDRKNFFMAFEGDVYFVRNKDFRLHEDGRLYKVPFNSNETRYSMEPLSDLNAYAETRQEMQKLLDSYMKIEQIDQTYKIFPLVPMAMNLKTLKAKQKEIVEKNQELEFPAK